MEDHKTWLIFKIVRVPDLTLTKYNTGGLRGIDSALEFHKEFLRQWSRKGILTGISIHLFYNYDPDRHNGDKMGVFLGFYGKAAALSNALSLSRSSSLLNMYLMEVVKTPDFPFPADLVRANGFEMAGKQKKSAYDMDKTMEEWEKLNDYSYSKCCILSKKEIFVEPDSEDEGEYYYTISRWEPNEEGRMIQFYRLLASLDERFLLRIDIYPVDWSDRIRTAFKKPVSRLKNKQSERTSIAVSRDYSIDTILKSYEDITRNMDGTPQFRVNTFAFGPILKDGALCDDVELALATLASESIEKGDYTITNISETGRSYGTFAFLDQMVQTSVIEDVQARCVRVFNKSKTGWEIMDKRAENHVLRFLPTIYTLEDLAPMFRLPVLNESDSIEIRKETSPAPVPGEKGILLGRDDNGYEVYFPLEMLAKHAFIAGVPGSGKTNLMHHLTSTLWRMGIPFLVFEPAKQEYRALANQKGMEELCIFSPNADMSFPLHINPFEFPKGLMLAEHIRQLEAVFEGAFPLENPMPFLLDTAIEGVYRTLGWKPETIYTDTTKLRFPTMSMLYRRLEEELGKTSYSEEISGNLKSALQVRIGSLLRREMGGIFDVPRSTFAPEKWLERPAIIELEAMGTGPANFTTLLLCTLIRESLKVNPYFPEKHARHVILIEEAHNLIGPESQPKAGNEADPKQAATAFVVKMLAEVRALKEAIVIADQLPTVMADEVIKNTGFKVGLRITSMDDRSLLCSTMSASSVQMEEMGSFHVGRALISYEGLQKPFTIQTHRWLGEGDAACIKDEKQREAVAAPKSDAELFELVKDRNSYKETARASIAIEIQKYIDKYFEFRDRTDECAEYLKEIKYKEYSIIHLKQEYLQSLEKMQSDLNIDTEDVNQLEQITKDISRLEEDLTRSKQSRLFRNAFHLCSNASEYTSEISDRRVHWKRLGLNEFSLECEDNYNRKVRLMCEGFLECAIKIYNYAYDYFDENQRQKMGKIIEARDRIAMCGKREVTNGQQKEPFGRGD